VEPASKEKIYAVKNGKSVHLDVKAELCAGCGVCVNACPYDVIRLSGRGDTSALIQA
jgi:4Fe-4S ferredoxin